jgi:beta-glucanase (GH16 family)
VALATVLVAAFGGAGLARSASGAEGPSVLERANFEGRTSGWHVDPGLKLTKVAGFRSQGAARIRNISPEPQKAVLRARVSAVRETKKGHVYRATAWLRTTAPGRKVALRLTERDGSVIHGRVLSVVTLTNQRWRKVTVRYTAKTTGSELRLSPIAWDLPASRAFDIDHIRLVGWTPRTPPRVDTSRARPAPAPTTAAPTPTASAPADWRLVWSDEFNGSAVDGSKWRVRNGDHNSNELSCLTNRPQNVSVSGGVLHIVAQREQYTCGGYSTSWTSGYLDTIGKMSRTYGRFEIRAKLPTQADTSKGLWPAFWLRPDDGGDGEIDIMEAVGSGVGDRNYNSISQTLWADYNNTYARQSHGVTFPAGDTMSDAFHTYAVEWEPGVIRFLVDGTVTYTRTSTDIPWLDKSFGRNFNIRLNMQVGGSWPGTPTASTQFPADYQIDWVHVYQR